MKVFTKELEQNSVQFTSDTFLENKECKQAVKNIKENIMQVFKAHSRNEIKIPNGLIKLQGRTQNGDWINLSNVIGKFNSHLESNIWIEYRVQSDKLIRIK